MRATCDWPDALVNRLRLVAQIFANALARKRFEMALRQSEERLNLTITSADLGICELDCRTQLFWASGRAGTSMRQTALLVAAAGANVLVAGSAVLGESEGVAPALKRLRTAVD